MGDELLQTKRVFHGASTALLWETECQLVTDGELVTPNSGNLQWIKQQSLDNLTVDHPHAIRPKADFTFTTVVLASFVEYFVLESTRHPDTGFPYNLICGPLVGALNAHLSHTRSVARFKHLTQEYHLVESAMDDEMDLLMVPITGGVVNEFGRLIQISSFISTWDTGNVLGQEIPARRPFIFLHTFTGLVWGLIILTIVVVTLFATANLRRGPKKGPPQERSDGSGRGVRLTWHRPVDLALKLTGQFLHQEIEILTPQYNYHVLGTWFLMCAVLTAIFDGSIFDLMSESFDPIIVNEWTDLLSPLYDSWILMLFAMSPEASIVNTFDGGSIFKRFNYSDRLQIIPDEEVLTMTGRFIVGATLYAGESFVIYNGKSLAIATWQIMSYACLAGVDVDFDRIRSLQYSPAISVEPAFLVFTSYASQGLINSFNGVIKMLQNTGIMTHLFEAGHERIHELLPHRAASGYETLTLAEDLVGAFYLLGIGLAFAVVFLLIWEIPYHSYKRGDPGRGRLCATVRSRIQIIPVGIADMRPGHHIGELHKVMGSYRGAGHHRRESEIIIGKQVTGLSAGGGDQRSGAESKIDQLTT